MKLRTKLLAVVLMLLGCIFLAQEWKKYGLLLDSAERCGSTLFSVLFIIGGAGILLRKRWGWHIAHGLLELWAIVLIMVGITGTLCDHFLHYRHHQPSPPLLLAACFAVLAVLCIMGAYLLRSDKPVGWSRQETPEEK